MQGHPNIASCTAVVIGPRCAAPGQPRAPQEPQTQAWGRAGATGAGPTLAKMRSGVLCHPGHPHSSGGCREVITCTPEAATPGEERDEPLAG